MPSVAELTANFPPKTKLGQDSIAVTAYFWDFLTRCLHVSLNCAETAGFFNQKNVVMSKRHCKNMHGQARDQSKNHA